MSVRKNYKCSRKNVVTFSKNVDEKMFATLPKMLMKNISDTFNKC
jgi:hypothetical protein